MSKKNMMLDPLGAPTIFEVESKITELDSKFKKNGIILNDSNVKSALAKAEKLAKTGSLNSKPEDKKEDAIFEMAMEIDNLRNNFLIFDEETEQGINRPELSLKFWLDVLDAIKTSLNLRIVTGGRIYLDYIADFIAKAKLQMK